MTDNVLLLGDPLLRQKARGVTFPLDDSAKKESGRLVAALEEFRKEVGFGRAISAPQIGISKNMIALHLDKEPFVMYNPEIIMYSNDTFLLWDDCMSFPDLVVKVPRYTSVSVKYWDMEGNEVVLEKLDRSYSELLQHEIDHLHGILAVDRAVDARSIVYKSVFLEKKEIFLKEVE